MSLRIYPSDPVGCLDSMSNSFTYCFAKEDTSGLINANYMLSELEGAFDQSSLHTLVIPVLDVPGPFPMTADGYSDFDILSSPFPAFSPRLHVDSATEDSNSCESVVSEKISDYAYCEVGQISPVDEFTSSRFQEGEMDPGPSADHLYIQSLQQVADRNYLQSNNNCCKMLMKEKCGVELVQLLVACAQAIAAGEVGAARQFVGRLSHLLSSKGSSMERVATYFTEALAECVGMKINHDQDKYNNNGQHKLSGLAFNEFPPAEESWIAYQVFYASCPYLIVTHFTANQAILEAFEGERMVHVVDLDIKQGLQWPSLIQALSLRNGGPPQLRITGVAGASPDFPSIMATRNRLLEFADMFNVPLEFTIITENMEDLQPWKLGVRDQEILAVNCVSSLHRLIDHPRRPLHNFLRMIHSLEPSVVTIVEQDANHHQEFFPRFVGALHYYSSMFDSLAASLSSSLAEREIVERLLLGKEIINIVGCEGDQRFERHQTVDQWIHHMTEAGFQLYPLSPHSVLQAKFLLSMYPVSKFSIVNDEAYLSVGWQDNPLYAVSCWC